MRRIRIAALFAVAVIILPLLLSSCSGDGVTETATLYVYNWGEYISDGSEGCLDSNAAFEDWYLENYGVKVKVNYSTF